MVVTALWEQVRLVTEYVKTLLEQHPAEVDAGHHNKASHFNLSTFDSTGKVGEFLERYEGYAVVQGLDEQRKVVDSKWLTY